MTERKRHIYNKRSKAEMLFTQKKKKKKKKKQKKKKQDFSFFLKEENKWLGRLGN